MILFNFVSNKVMTGTYCKMLITICMYSLWPTFLLSL